MRVCPKCGYVDHPYWRHQRWSYWIDFCAYEEFKEIRPELAEKLKLGGVVEDKYYLYRRIQGRGKSRDIVHRKAKIDYGTTWHIPMERVDHRTGGGPGLDSSHYYKRFAENKKLDEFIRGSSSCKKRKISVNGS